MRRRPASRRGRGRARADREGGGASCARGGLRGAFDPVMSEVPPPRFAAAEVIDFGARATERDQRRGWFAVPQWAAMAATLALGVVVGQFVGERRGPRSKAATACWSPRRRWTRHSTRNSLRRATGEVRVGLTFRDRQGGICRSFTDEAASGLACRDGQIGGSTACSRRLRDSRATIEWRLARIRGWPR